MTDDSATNGLLVNEIDTGEGLLVAVADRELLGKTFEEGRISLTVTEEFYGGEPADEPTVVERITSAHVANIVGTRAVDLAVEAGLVDEENVLDVDGTRHAQLLHLG